MTLPKTVGFDPTTDRIMVIEGCSVASPPTKPAEGQPVYKLTRHDSGAFHQCDRIYVEEYPPLSYFPFDGFPRVRSIGIHPYVKVGTIDELVTDYRVKLEAAVSSLYALDYPEYDPTLMNVRAMSEAAQPLFAEMHKQGLKTVEPINSTHPTIVEFNKKVAEMQRAADAVKSHSL